MPGTTRILQVKYRRRKRNLDIEKNMHVFLNLKKLSTILYMVTDRTRIVFPIIYFLKMVTGSTCAAFFAGI